jgi:dolichyl-phosphate beta-glucosyltransferase
MTPSVSIIIPAYNEATRLGRTLATVSAYLDSYPSAELLVVDDGSRDATATVAEECLAKHCHAPWQVLRSSENRGKGHAVKRGVLAARAPVALFSDADLSTPISELPKLVDRIARGTCDIAFGSRAVDRRLIETPQPFYRDRAGRLFNGALRIATGLPFLDTQCGFKAFRMSVCRPLFEAATIDGFGFDVELLFVAHRAGLTLQEVAVRWRHEEGSKVRLSRDGPRMLADIATVRRLMWAGHYDSALNAATAALGERQWGPLNVRHALR